MGSLGERLRAARTAKGISLRATAAAAGVSPSLLSQVENGHIQPSVSTLYSVVSYLGLSIDTLLDHHPDASEPASPETDDDGSLRGIGRSPVQRHEDSPIVTMDNGVTWERLAVLSTTDLVDPILTTYAPRGASSIDDTHMRHEGVEYGYVIRGELTLKLEFETYLLRAGDSVCFDSRRPHLYINHTDEVTQGLWTVIGHPAAGPDPAERPTVIRSAADVLEVLDRTPRARDPRPSAGRE